MNRNYILNFWNAITTNSVKLSVIICSVVLLVFTQVSLISNNSMSEFLNGIHVELFGVLCDALILVLLFNWIHAIGENKRKIESYLEAIDDFKDWRSEEAKFIIRGNIKRLNKLSYTKLKVSFLDISDNSSTAGQLNFSNGKLDGSKILSGNFSNLNMTNSSFVGITDHCSKFINTGLLNADFRNCHLQGTVFQKAFLHAAKFNGSTLTLKTDFRGANIKFADFSNVTIDSAEFEDAEVNEDFFNKVANWNIIGNNVFNNYKIKKTLVRNNKYKYNLTAK